MREFMERYPELRSGIRVAVYTFLSMFLLATIGWLGDVQEWATTDGAVFPSVSILGKALAAGLASAVSGLFAFIYNLLPGTTTAQYPTGTDGPPDRGDITIAEVFVIVFLAAVVVLVVVLV